MENQEISSQHIQRLLGKPDQDEKMDVEDAKFYLRKRYLVAFLVFLGWALLFLLRMNLSISIVDMNSSHSINIGNKTWVEEAEYRWSSKEKGLILSAFAWGYMASPLGAFAVKKYGGAASFGAGVTVTGLLTTLTPVLINWNFVFYLVVRIFEGVFEGIAAAAVVEVLRRWSPPDERFRLMAGSGSGYLFGAMISYPICGTIAYYLNWQAVFYITGGITLLWSMTWFALVRSSPAEDHLISIREKRYLKQRIVCISETDKEIVFPWCQILKSKAVWAFLNDRFVAGWPSSFLAYSLPLYIKDVFDVNIRDIGLLSSLPHLFGPFGMIAGSLLGDYLQNRGLLSTTDVHKLFLSFAQFVALALLLLVALWKNFWANIVCFCIFRLLVSVCVTSYEVLSVDMGGQYACLLHGLSITSLGLGLGLSPLLMGLIVTEHSTAQWSIYFLAMSGFNLWGSMIFYKYGSGDLQPWAVLSDKTDEEQTEHERQDDSNDI